MGGPEMLEGITADGRLSFFQAALHLRRCKDPIRGARKSLSLTTLTP